MSKAAYIDALSKGARQLKGGSADITLVHHNDADGLAAATVLHEAFIRGGFSVHRIPLERVHPPIIERIHDTASGQVVYTDLGGRAAPVICDANAGRLPTLIVDHHIAEESTDPSVLNLSSELFNVSGEKDISAATAAWLFAQQLQADNSDLAYLGVIGAMGDSHDRDGLLVGENREALMHAVSRESVRITPTDDGEDYMLTQFQKPVSLSQFAKSLTTLGAAGYMMSGPKIGVKTCLSGPCGEYTDLLAQLEEIKRERFNRVLDRLGKEGLTQAKHTQWFSVGDCFEPMGVKIIGEFCMEIRNKEFVDDAKYIAGFQDMPTKIPELGGFDWNLVKVSMRLPSPLEELVLAGKVPGLAWLVPEAARQVGGSIDACHDYAAAALVDRGREAALIQAMDSLFDEKTE